MKLLMLLRRNLSLFFSNKMNILLSIASVGVVVSLYIIFLRDFMIDYVSRCGISGDYVEVFTDRVMFISLIPIISTTTSFGTAQLYVSDIEQGINRDFLISPISKSAVMVSYWLSAGIISCCFSLTAFWCFEVYFRVYYDNTLSADIVLKVLLVVIWSAFVNSALVVVISKKLKRTATFATFANLYGTLCGFLAGSYLPYSFYPSWIRPVLFFYPPSQMVSILRQLVSENMKDNLFENGELLDKFFSNMGVVLEFNASSVSIYQNMAVLSAGTVVLIFLLCKNKR